MNLISYYPYLPYVGIEWYCYLYVSAIEIIEIKGPKYCNS
jgi:hypothetical protein